MKLTPNCHEVTTRLWSPLHQIDLSTRERIGVQAHLLVCPRCRRDQRTFKWILKTLEQVPESPALSVSYKMSPATKTRLKTRIAEEVH